MPATERVFWRSDSCTVWVGYNDRGELVFNGDESALMVEPGVHHKYWVTVAPDQFDKLRTALGADPCVGVVDLVCAHVDEIIARGERTSLDDRGIERGLTSY